MKSVLAYAVSAALMALGGSALAGSGSLSRSSIYTKPKASSSTTAEVRGPVGPQGSVGPAGDGNSSAAPKPAGAPHR